MLPSAYIVFMTLSKLLFITLFSTKRKEVNDVTLRRRSWQRSAILLSTKKRNV